MAWRTVLASLLAASGLVGCSGEGDQKADALNVGQVSQEVGVGVPSSLSLPQGKIYLTFDDGPHRDYTPKILDVLRDEGVKATFFITGTRIAGRESLMRREAAEGHIVANHQWEHVVASTAQLRVWAPKERNLIDQVLGNTQHPYFFRYPYGSGSTAKEAVLQANNYPDGGIGWHMDSLDWCFSSTGTCRRSEVKAANRSNFIQHVMDSAASRNGNGVILFHDVQKITANNIKTLIQKFKQRGYTFGTLPQQGHGFGGPGH